mmetsp:Transcript_15120/g.18401  ORF Transcript_15120/g.18401 Transcript_15120/m.18401 type:complete len:1165 (+) Transcript_15120:2-3496(+)
MEKGKAKAERADRLLVNLADEQARWDDEAKNFSERMALVVPDALRAAAIIAYAGKLIDKDRHRLCDKVNEVLYKLALSPECKEISNFHTVAAYLCNASTIREWHEDYGLPRDERYLTNASIFSTTQRCALLVDPSGAATRFIEAMLGASRVVNSTTASDPSFEKTLATCARFGGALIVHDVDDVWDSVAHPLLNREFVRRGGRSGGAMVKLGALDPVEVSPDFRLILHARDARATRKLPLGLLGRVCLLDFSTTLDGLEQSVLTRMLRVERPELEKQRTEAQRTVDEQKSRLEALEDDVLRQIAGDDQDEEIDVDEATPASILDDDKALQALENTKAEAKALREQAERGTAALAELRLATRAYVPAARCCAKLYALISRLPKVHAAYEYSLEFFLDNILTPALRHIESEEKDIVSRLCRPVLYHVSRRIGRGLLRREHRVAAAVATARLFIEARDTTLLSMCDAALVATFTDKSSTTSDDNTKNAAIKIASGLCISLGAAEVKRRAEALSKLLSASVLPKAMLDNIESWSALGKVAEPEDEAFRLLSSRNDNAVEELAAARAAAFIKAIHPERSSNAAIQFARIVLGDATIKAWLGESSSSSIEEAAIDATTLIEVREKATKCKNKNACDLLALEADGDAVSTPTILVIVEPASGRDGSTDVENLAAARGFTLESVTMGAPESQVRANAALQRCAERGHWLLLCNAHLAASDWLDSLERRLRSLAASVSSISSQVSEQRFILFLSAEAMILSDPSTQVHSWRLPRALTARSQAVALGVAHGVRAGLLRHFDLVDARIGKESWSLPPAERIRVYALLGWAHTIVTERVRYTRGWSKPYEWGDVDAFCALAQIDASLASLKNMTHADPCSDLAWDVIRGAFVSTYGSRLEVSADFRVLTALADTILNPQAYENDWTPASTLKPWPQGALFTSESWREWIEQLSPSNDCSWLGLAPEADATRAADRLLDLCQVASRLIFSDEFILSQPSSEKVISSSFEIVKQADVVSVAGEQVVDALKHEVQRVVVHTKNTIRLGALTWPKRFLNAVRLDAAKQLGTAIDDLELALLPVVEEDSLMVDGLFVRGASWQENALSLEPGQADDTGAISLPQLRLVWQKKELTSSSDFIRLPLVMCSLLLDGDVALPRNNAATDNYIYYLRNAVIEARP